MLNNFIDLSSQIRKNSGETLLRDISIARMHGKLIDLFFDRTSIDTSLARFFNEDNLKETLAYNDCLRLNDKETRDFHKTFEQASDKPVDESHNFFIPFEDGDNIE
ncbi:hypothetical protein IKD48_00110 [bacterium]|nr:hypothetical protein [bacterium]